VLTKSGVAQLLGEAGGYMAFGGPVTCPACRREIDAKKMIDGEFDVPEAGGLLAFLVLAWIVGGPFLLSIRFDWPLGWAIVTPWAVALLLALLLAGALRLRRR
jgi:hypothetical protein